MQALWGVGPATLRAARRLGVATVGDLAALPTTLLVARARPGQRAPTCTRSPTAVDDRPVVPDREMKSIGHEETFARDLHERAALVREVVRLADAVGGAAARSTGWPAAR